MAQFNNYSMIVKGFVVMLFLFFPILSCENGQEEETQEDTRTVSEIKGAEEHVSEVLEATKLRTFDKLFEVIPELSVIDTENQDGYYLGSFYLDKSGQLSALYQGSAARMEIQHIERSEYEMSVYYLFQYIGNEISDESGPVRFFYFTVTAEQMEEELQEEEDGMFIKVLVTEINRGDIPGEVQS